jgi:hypothetical protein
VRDCGCLMRLSSRTVTRWTPRSGFSSDATAVHLPSLRETSEVHLNVHLDVHLDNARSGVER